MIELTIQNDTAFRIRFSRCSISFCIICNNRVRFCIHNVDLQSHVSVSCIRHTHDCAISVRIFQCSQSIRTNRRRLGLTAGNQFTPLPCVAVITRHLIRAVEHKSARFCRLTAAVEIFSARALNTVRDYPTAYGGILCPVPHRTRYLIIKEGYKRHIVSLELEYQVIVQAVLTVKRNIRHIFLITVIQRNIVRRTLMRACV